MPDQTIALPTPPARTLRCLQIGLKWFESGAGGLDRFFSGLVTDLPAAGITVGGIVVGPDDAERRSGGLVRGIGCADASLPRRLLAARRAIATEIATGRYDLVASHFAMLTAASIDRLGGLPLVVHFHGPWAAESAVEGQGGPAIVAKRTLERLVYGRATLVVTLSQAFADLAHETLAVPRRKLRVVPGSAEIDRFAIALDRGAARTRLGLPHDRRILVAVRRLASRMGLDDLVRAMRKVADRHPDVLLLIGGKGHKAEALQAEATALGLGAHVRFLGFVPDDDLPALYRAADLNLVPTIALEGFGLTTVEALAAGTPSMVTPVGGLPETMRPLSPDLVFEATGADAIARGLDRFLSGAFAVPDSQACRLASRRYEGGRIAGEIAAVYREAVLIRAGAPGGGTPVGRTPRIGTPT